MTLLRKGTTAVVALLALTFMLAAAQQGAPKDSPKKAICVLKPTMNNKVSGVITFTQKDGAVEITGEITGLTPGPHGFHVHEFGDLNSPDGMATGGHFNPDKAMHGGPHDSDRHVG